MTTRLKRQVFLTHPDNLECFVKSDGPAPLWAVELRFSTLLPVKEANGEPLFRDITPFIEYFDRPMEMIPLTPLIFGDETWENRLRVKIFSIS